MRKPRAKKFNTKNGIDVATCLVNREVYIMLTRHVKNQFYEVEGFWTHLTLSQSKDLVKTLEKFNAYLEAKQKEGK